MNHAAELPAEIFRLEQDLEGVLADRDHWREEREREARCQLTRRIAELLRKGGGHVDIADHRRVRKPRSADTNSGATGAAPLPVLPAFRAGWLLGGPCVGRKYVVPTPTRHDAHPGSFSINMQSGKWGDFSV